MKFKFITSETIRIGESNVYQLGSIEVEYELNEGVTYDQAYEAAYALAVPKVPEGHRIFAGFGE